VDSRGNDIVAEIGTNAATLDWRLLYEANAPDLLRFLRRFVKETHTAEDLLHDTFARAMRARTTPTDEREARPWLYRIAANVALTHLRRARRFSPLRDLVAHEVPAVGESEQVRQALRSVPPEQALTLTLVLHDGFTRREAAEILGVSDETIKSRIARGRLNFVAAYRRLERGLAR
jgi:RNA polymerase sigma-70 factor, ECF subfamily